MGSNNKKAQDEERRSRSLMLYGTGEAAPSESVRQHFGIFSLALSGPIAIAIDKALLERDHEFSRGSDGLELVRGLIPQTAAEVWAARQIVLGGLAPLMVLHHARGLYEAHAMAHWMFRDFDSRWERLLKDALRERQRFEAAARASIGEVASDLTDLGRALVDDAAVAPPPSLWDMIPGNPVLQYDHAIFWKYASAFTHPGSNYTGATDARSERIMIEQELAGIIRHSAAVYRLITDHFALGIGEVAGALREAEEYSRYSFDVPAALGGAVR
ncbi:MAG: hypothetical protein ACREWE_16530 [Gammaproteobacteria bacterium]